MSKGFADQGGRLVHIEFLRFFSALAVLIWHFQHFHFHTAGRDLADDRSIQPFYDLLSIAYDGGYLGVQMFWAISGFIFFYTYYQKIHDDKVSAQQFAINRFSRLWPLHFLTLLVVALLQTAYTALNGTSFVYDNNGVWPFLAHVFFVQGMAFGDIQSFNGPSWSVSLEIPVYLLFFFLVSRLNGLMRIYLLALTLTTIAASLGLVLLAKCMALFFAGGFIALVRYLPGAFSDHPSIRRYLFGITCGATIVIAMSLGYYYERTTGAAEYHFAFTVTACMTLIYTCLLMNPLFNPAGKIWCFLGNLTYASYMIHFPLQIILVLVYDAMGWSVDARDPVLFLVYILSVLFMSAGVYRWIEMPLMGWARRSVANTPPRKNLKQSTPGHIHPHSG